MFKIIRIDIDNIIPGMVVATPVINSDGVILLRENVVLNQSFIDRMKGIGISAIDIKIDGTEDIVINDVICQKIKSTAIKELKDLTADILNNKIGIRNNTVPKIVESIILEIIEEPNVIIGISEIRTEGDYLYYHSVSVCVLSIIIGMSLQLPRQNLLDLGIGALLHDIGKTGISKKILNKKGKLTTGEMNEIKLHSKIGFEIIRNRLKLSSVAAHVAYQHHERLDGSGYPRGLKGEEIHKLAKIVAVTDVYDALTSSRPYRKGYMPLETINYFQDNKGKLFDDEVVEALVKKVSIYPVGAMVVLNTGHQGFVKKVNWANLDKPVVKVMIDKFGRALSEPFDVDLSVETKVKIIEVFEYGFPHKNKNIV